MRSRSPSTRPVIVVVGDILAAWESPFANSLPRDRETISKITTSSLHRNNNSQGDEYYERFVVIESIPMFRPFLPPTVLPVVYFVDFRSIAIGPRARSILFETKILLESVTNIEPSLQMASSPVLPAVTVFLDYERDRGKIDLSFRVSVRIGCMGIVTGFEHIEQRQWSSSIIVSHAAHILRP